MFKRFLKALLAIAAAITGVVLLFSFLSRWYPAADSVAHFRFHLTAILVLAAVLMYLLGERRFVAVSLAVSIAGLAGMTQAFPGIGGPDSQGGGQEITVVQLNLSFRNSTPQAVADFVRSEQADVVTFQEVTAETGQVIEILKDDYPNSAFCPFHKRIGGVAVLSRLPMAPGAAHGCEARGVAWMQVMAGGRPLTVASLHLEWPWPFKQDRQVGNLEKQLPSLPRPILLSGDFNAAPWSNSVHRVAAATDTSVAHGLRFSYDIRFRRWIPPVAMPIDHILLPDAVTLLDVRTGPGPGSDHRSVIARLSLEKGKETSHARVEPAPGAASVN